MKRKKYLLISLVNATLFERVRSNDSDARVGCMVNVDIVLNLKTHALPRVLFHSQARQVKGETHANKEHSDPKHTANYKQIIPLFKLKTT